VAEAYADMVQQLVSRGGSPSSSGRVPGGPLRTRRVLAV